MGIEELKKEIKEILDSYNFMNRIDSAVDSYIGKNKKALEEFLKFLKEEKPTKKQYMFEKLWELTEEEVEIVIGVEGMPELDYLYQENHKYIDPNYRPGTII